MTAIAESTESVRKVPVRWAWGLFAAWLGLLSIALGGEHSALGRAVFEGKLVWLYLVLQGALHLAAVVACVWVLARGTFKQRLLIALPTLLLVLYGLVALGGPG